MNGEQSNISEDQRSSFSASLDRCSEENELVLVKNVSLIDAMSLKSSRKSIDIYDEFLKSTPARDAQSRFSSGGAIFASGNSKQVRSGIQEPSLYPEIERPGAPHINEIYAQNNPICHTCVCYTACQSTTCPCFVASHERCVEGLCCAMCLDAKKKLLKQIERSVSCTCKKTKCNKKYCSCFAAGMKCGNHCTCEGCINYDKFSDHHMEIEDSECYMEEDLNQIPMPEQMDFEEVNFRFSISNAFIFQQEDFFGIVIRRENVILKVNQQILSE